MRGWFPEKLQWRQCWLNPQFWELRKKTLPSFVVFAHSHNFHLLPASITLLVFCYARSGKISAWPFAVYPPLWQGISISSGVSPAAGGAEIGGTCVLPELSVKEPLRSCFPVRAPSRYWCQPAAFVCFLSVYLTAFSKMHWCVACAKSCSDAKERTGHCFLKIRQIWDFKMRFASIYLRTGAPTMAFRQNNFQSI